VRFAIVGSGGVGGYYGALLARAGNQVSFVARGAHLEAIRANGMRVVGPLGDFIVRASAESDSARIGPVDAVIFAVKTYDNGAAVRLLPPLVGSDTVVLTLQNGVDSAGQVAAGVGEGRTLAGATYIATAIEAPGVIRQTGTHRRIVFGEWFRPPAEVSSRVRALEHVMQAADIQAEAVSDARPAVWEKFTYLAPFAAFTGAARLPIGPLWQDEDCRRIFLDAVAEVAAVASAHGVQMPPDHLERVQRYAAAMPPDMRSSLLVDLSQGKRIEVEALQGSVVRRGRAAGVPTPLMAALYAVLKPHAEGGRTGVVGGRPGSDPGLTPV
jgi:2-dehydropantoate 2-reductase